VFPASEGTVNEEELAKVLGAIAHAGRALVDFDNVRCTVDGAPLLAALTTVEQQEFRILGQSRDALLVWRAVVCIGGNNLAIGDEMSRRALLARLEPDDERHELRADLPREKGGYLHPRLREWVAAERPRLVVAALTVLRAWYLAGRPKGGARTKASFEEWSDVIPHALLWAGGPDASACVPSQGAEDEDPSKAALRALLTVWGRFCGPDGMTARTLVANLYPDGRRPKAGEGPPDEALDAARDAIEHLTRHRGGDRAPSAGKLGPALKSFKGTKLGGKCLIACGKTGGSVRWRTK
jgi:putative DNA primase/helicase